MHVRSKENEEKRPFFVYGTLLPGQSNAYLWQDAVTSQQAATLAGSALYDMGSYPMLVETGTESVHGIVFHTADTDYHTILARLDALEGYDPAQPNEYGYKRVVREVQVTNASPEPDRNGRFLSAWVYIGEEAAVRGFMPIAHGDWRAYAAHTFQNIETWLQTVTSVHGLHQPPST
jgi:gamma-glutamylcyclotransferase (GGCT)/AIG2-like uncharacterized protein YtfP